MRRDGPPCATTLPATNDPLAEALATDLAGTFERVVLTYQDRLYTFALRLCGDRRDAEEIAQDAFVRAYHALQAYDTARIRELALRPWLYRITLNLARNRARGRRLILLPLPDDNLSAHDGPTIPPLFDQEAQRPEWRAERTELSARLVAALATLPPRYHTAIILRHVEGLSYPELAAALALPLGTVKAQVHRGIALLRMNWLALYPEEREND